MPEHAGTLRTSYYLALTTYSEGKYTEAETLLRQNLAIYVRTLPDSWERYRCESLLGATVAAQQKYSEAEPLLLDGVQGMLQRESTIAWFGASDPARARGYLVRLYQAWGKPAKAAEWQKTIAADR
jgi:eukaryotic-like serine/threonine-protein kinase